MTIMSALLTLDHTRLRQSSCYQHKVGKFSKNLPSESHIGLD